MTQLTPEARTKCSHPRVAPEEISARQPSPTAANITESRQRSLGTCWWEHTGPPVVQLYRRRNWAEIWSRLQMQLPVFTVCRRGKGKCYTKPQGYKKWFSGFGKLYWTNESVSSMIILRKNSNNNKAGLSTIFKTQESQGVRIKWKSHLNRSVKLWNIEVREKIWKAAEWRPVATQEKESIVI